MNKVINSMGERRRYVPYVAVFVNYQNAQLSIDCAESLKVSFLSDELLIIIVDNSLEAGEWKKLNNFAASYPGAIEVLISEQNVGYFSGLNEGLARIHSEGIDFDCVIVGNNDLIFSKDFRSKLKDCLDNFASYPVIAPNLLDLTGRPQNPHVLKEYSAIRILGYKLYFSNYIIGEGARFVIRHLKRILKKNTVNAEQTRPIEIYQGYGACYILTKRYFDYYEDLPSFTFLMGEEAFLALRLKAKNLGMLYHPGLLIYHLDHSSIGRLSSKKLWLLNKIAFKKFLDLSREPLNKHLSS